MTAIAEVFAQDNPGAGVLPRTPLRAGVRTWRATLAARLPGRGDFPAAWFVAIAVLSALVVAPVVSLFFESLTDAAGRGLTVANYVEAYGEWRHLRALGNTMLLGAMVCAGAAGLALPLAWAVARTDIGCKRFIWLSVLCAFICPPYLMAVGWMLLAGPRAGFINRVWGYVTGATEPLVNVFTFGGIAFVMSASLFFFVFSFTMAALDAISSELEEAATILGARWWRTAASVTLPLAAPAILGGLVIVFLQAIALFGIPALLAYPARVPLLVTTLLEFFELPVRVGAAAAYAMPLLLVTIVLGVVQRRLVRRRSYVTMTGKAGQRELVRLKRWRIPVTVLAVTQCALICLLPLAALIEAAFTRTWSGGPLPGNLTLDNVAALITREGLRHALVNSIVYAAASAAFAIVLSVGVAYLVVRRKAAFAPLLGFLAMSPYVIPGIVLSIGFYAVFAAPPVSLYGTGLLLVLAFTVRFMPITYASAAASLNTFAPEMEEAARSLGAGRLRVVWEVTAPLIRRSIIGSGILVFVLASHELSTAVLLAGPSTRLVSLSMLELADNGQIESLAAMGTALIAIMAVLIALGYRLVGRDLLMRS